MSGEYQSFTLKRARRVYDQYNVINSLSFALVTGNTITLYALLLGARSTTVGLLSACMHFSFFALPLGKLVCRRFGVIKTFAYTWIARNTSLLPMLAIPHLYAQDYTALALYVLIFSVALFNFFRGMGMIANNPVITMLAPGKHRSSYIVRISLANNSAILIATLLLSGALSVNASLTTYHFATALGIALGFFASFLLFTLPTVESCEHVQHTSPETPRTSPRSGYTTILRALKEKNFRTFTFAFFVSSFATGTVRPFVVVFAKDVYHTPDSFITILTVCASGGALIVGFIMSLAIDRIGAKPMYIISSVLSVLTLIPALGTPGLHSSFLSIAFLCLFCATTSMGFTGQDNAAQSYFFVLVPEDALIDVSVLYYLILGITGGAGSVIGGVVLDFCHLSGYSSLQAYRIFFTGVSAIMIIGIALQTQLRNLGGYRVLRTLATLCSPKDLRTLSLLHKLDFNENLETEQHIVQELSTIASPISAEQLGTYVQSPRFSIRASALQALETIPSLSTHNRNLLLRELREGTFTTAAQAARILGIHMVQQAIPILREALHSEDYLLVGEALVALARTHDDESHFLIGHVLARTQNPFVVLRGLQALEMLNSVHALPPLFEILRTTCKNTQTHTEALLTLSVLMGIQNEFYFLFERYRTGHTTVQALVREKLEESFAISRVTDATLEKTLERFTADARAGTHVVMWVLARAGEDLGTKTALLLSLTLENPLCAREAFRLLIGTWTATLFRKPALMCS
ncbi:MFS transporter [Treponema pallidum]|uniref:Conserved hypothetical integral membrane protein n=2 Tax=Treponema pallidum subsp. pallidum TaxID=161 RepID=O83812_TREPA|nr:MFS transporter [Treponema pallidum]AAC65806.1 conserved hypothetical integral membrane protein [Treponema pallidum subsp. pallidum str. Nichols]ACD71257.1 hypothetical integral membrane protein [Treponema pallidum subsp. pallidum SS14]ADD72933.1 putative transporter, major facilitator family [Treponema pallidum subsp. pallidum str. Chicago]AEZ61169.1 putative membrane protein [Treponema pallidum subsp. pallidum DAL-1]AFU66820.1 putative membrane protein [Treponema pallidum subsp. pallidum 